MRVEEKVRLVLLRLVNTALRDDVLQLKEEIWGLFSFQINKSVTKFAAS